MGSGTRRIAAVVLGGLLLTACGGGSDDQDEVSAPVATPTAEATVSAEPSAVPSSAPNDVGADLDLNARLLSEIVDEIDETAKGFAQVVQNIPKRKLTIYWKGNPPQSVASLEGTSGTGVEVVIVEAKLSKADVEAAIRRISQAAQAGTVPSPDSISANKDFSGIVIGFTDAHFAANNSARTRARYEAIAKVPVTIAQAAAHAPD